MMHACNIIQRAHVRTRITRTYIILILYIILYYTTYVYHYYYYHHHHRIIYISISLSERFLSRIFFFDF